MIYSRGIKVWPGGFPETLTGDTCRCRFMASAEQWQHASKSSPCSAASKGGIEVIKTENLFNFDGQPGYSLGQGSKWNGKAPGRRHHGQQVRLGNHAARRRKC